MGFACLGELHVRGTMQFVLFLGLDSLVLLSAICLRSGMQEEFARFLLFAHLPWYEPTTLYQVSCGRTFLSSV